MRVRAQLDAPGRWLWLVKWFLLIPHYIVLVGIAFVALLTEVYPPFRLDLGGDEPHGDPSDPIDAGQARDVPVMEPQTVGVTRA